MGIKNIDTRWQKIPPRDSKEWHQLMGQIMRNFNNAMISVKLTNSELKGFKSPNVRPFLVDVQNWGLIDTVERRGLYAMGVILKEMQPHILPWVKIAKVKIAKEFRFWLAECVRKRRKRQEHRHMQMPLLVLRVKKAYYNSYDRDFYILSLSGVMPKYKQPKDRYAWRGRQHGVLLSKTSPLAATLIKKFPNDETVCIGVCRAGTRPALGFLEGHNASFDARRWGEKGLLVMVDRWTRETGKEIPDWVLLKDHKAGNRTWQTFSDARSGKIPIYRSILGNENGHK